jgi:parvulin-like peptidyl-prolyl isomerase
MKKLITAIFVCSLFAAGCVSSTSKKAQSQLPANTVKASHILVKVNPSGGPNEKQAQLKRITAIRDEALKGGDFAKLAMKHSDCPSKQRGGDLGVFRRGMMVKPFEEAAFSQPVGRVGSIVETQFGYHIILVTARN